LEDGRQWSDSGTEAERANQGGQLSLCILLVHFFVLEASMNTIPGSSTQRIPPYNPEQQASIAKGAHTASNVDRTGLSADMAAPHVAQTQVEGANSGYHERMEFVLEQVPNSKEAICDDVVLRTQLDQIAQIIKEMDPREVEIKVFSPCFKELGHLRGVAVSAYLKEQCISEHLLDVKLRGPGLANKHFGLAQESGIIIELHPKEAGKAQRSAPFEAGHIRA